MFRLSQNFVDIPILSLRTGGEIGRAMAPIINPNNLKMEGWYCQDKFSKETLVLLAQDVREIIPQGITVNDHDVLSLPDELLRLQEVMKLRFELIGKHVITDQKRRVGKVSDYATDLDSLMVIKLYVNQTLLKTITGGQLSIDRSQVIEITDKYVKVRDVDEKIGSPITLPASA